MQYLVMRPDNPAEGPHALLGLCRTNMKGFMVVTGIVLVQSACQGVVITARLKSAQHALHTCVWLMIASAQLCSGGGWGRSRASLGI